MMANQEITPNKLIPDLTQANKFLYKIMCFKQTCFQTFASRVGDRIVPAHHHGSLKDLSDWLTRQNQAGGGVYFVVNETDGKGRRAENIRKIRSVFVDLDHSPIGPVLDCKLKPHVIVESSPGKYQAFWRCKQVAVDEFLPIQKALAIRFEGDDNVNTLERVMRVPGFWHLKKEPFMTHIFQENLGLPYTKDMIVDGIGLEVVWEPEDKKVEFENVDDGIRFNRGERNRKLVTVAARLRNSSLSGEDLLEALMKVNKAKCIPPLPKSDVAKIAKWANKKGIREITPARYFETHPPIDMAEPIPDDPIAFGEPVSQPIVEKPTVLTTTNPPADSPVLRSWHQLARTELPPAKWVVQGILPQGLILFIGQAKTGKSWLCQAMAMQIARGEPVLGHFASNKGEVCVLALEDTHQRFKARMLKLTGGNADMVPKNATYAVRWPRLPECVAPIERWAESCSNPRLLVIDVLNKMRPRANKADAFSDAYQRDYAFMTHFHTLAHKFKIAIVMIHHEKKGDKEDDYSRASGSAALGAAADGLWILNHSERRENRGTLVVSGRDFESNEFTLEFDKPTGLWRFVGEEKEVTMSEIQEKVLDIMQNEGRPMSPSEVAEAGDIKAGSAKSAIYRLIQKGLVSKSVTHGYRYILTHKFTNTNAPTKEDNRNSGHFFLGEEM